jgi:ribose transport system ATP-binding protein
VAAPLLKLNSVRKAFGAALALDGADLEVAPGEVHALVGENGAGKSTLMGVLGGSFPPDAGAMVFQERPYAPASPREARSAGIALIHQELALAPHLSVEANVTLGREQAPLGLLRDKSARVQRILESLGYGHLDPKMRVSALGVAERQIVEIARALYVEARLVLMDEPTSSLAARDVDYLFEAIRRLKARGVAIVYISHFLEEVRKVSDRITVLRDGRTVSANLPAATPMAEILRAMVGRPVTEVFPPSARRPEDAALSLRNLVVRPGAAPLSLELRRGEILGLAGLVGSGRSSLLRSLAGLRRPASGRLELAAGNLDVTDLSPARARAAGLGYLSEDRKEEGLALNLSIRENMTLGALRRFRWRGAPGLLDRAREASETEALCGDLGVRYRGVDRPIGGLSGGNQQKCALGRLLLEGAEVWLLDEPTRGVDVGGKAELYRLIAAEAAKGKAILWAGSYLPELFGVCDTLAVMHKGVLSPARPVAEWTEGSVMAWATTGRGE